MLLNGFSSLIPKVTRDCFKNFTELRKFSPRSNYISFRAISKIDDRPYTIRVLNIEGELYKTNKSESMKLYLQELFYLSARFGRNIGDIDSPDEILFFKNFEVGDNGAMAFVMRKNLGLKEVISEKDTMKALCIEDFVKEILADVLYINSRFGIANIELSLESVCCFDFRDEPSQSQEKPLSNYFITGWESGRVSNPILDTFNEEKEDLNDLKSTDYSKASGEDQFTLSPLKELFSDYDVSQEIYSIGFIALEMVGMPKNLWEDLLKNENPRNYNLILEGSILQSLVEEYGQSLSFCSLISSMLKREALLRNIETKQKILLGYIPSESRQEIKNNFLQLMHPLYPFSELRSLVKVLRDDDKKKAEQQISNKSFTEDEIEERKSIVIHRGFSELNQKLLSKSASDGISNASFLKKIQVQLLIILKRLYHQKIPVLSSMEPGICIQDCIKYILKRAIRASQPRDKHLHPDVKKLLNNSNPGDLTEMTFEAQSIGDLEAFSIGKYTKWTNLQYINMPLNHISDRGVFELAENKTWPNLETLNLRGNLISEEGAIRIGLNQSWPALKSLLLYQNMIGDEGAKGIASNTIWKKLERLELARNYISDEGVAAIGANVTWKMLCTLRLYENDIGDQGACALASNTSWSKLKELDLEKNKIGYDGAVAIAKNTAWSQLETCYLSGNLIGEKGIAFVLDNHPWKMLRDLTVEYTCISVGEFCHLCKMSLKNSFPQCYNFQKKIYYCYECVKKEESVIFGLKLGLKKSVDSSALIFIEAGSKYMLNKILDSRIGEQANPKGVPSGKNYKYHQSLCDACEDYIGEKIRWKCLNCKNVDICDRCHELSRKRDPHTTVILKIRGHDVGSHVLQRYIFLEKD